MKPENHNYNNVIIIIPDIKNKEITVKRKYNSWHEDGNARTYRKTCHFTQPIR